MGREGSNNRATVQYFLKIHLAAKVSVIVETEFHDCFIFASILIAHRNGEDEKMKKYFFIVRRRWESRGSARVLLTDVSGLSR